jgi:hypothetical protein
MLMDCRLALGSCTTERWNTDALSLRLWCSDKPEYSRMYPRINAPMQKPPRRLIRSKMV